ncbi:hypothetical protein ACDJ03_19715 [Xanthomonas axonopodis pv. nakataecorchori]|uniref:hypothetical protein n=1 Tax=Xanthomonas axonopodis TaxID=53413 RepID=UPI0035308E95
MKKYDISGQRFERLTALRRVGTYKGGMAIWLCRCDCGQEREVMSTHLRNGHTRSCGCLWRDTVVIPQTKHGLSHLPEYSIWKNMLSRCFDPKDHAFSRYGGRGIVVCSHWMHFENFLRDMGRRPSPALTIDRIKNDRGYEPDNCRWATIEQQSANRGDNLHLTYQGRTQTLSQWARDLGITVSGLHYRLKRHPVDVALAAGRPSANTSVRGRA